MYTDNKTWIEFFFLPPSDVGYFFLFFCKCIYLTSVSPACHVSTLNSLLFERGSVEVKDRKVLKLTAPAAKNVLGSRPRHLRQFIRRRSRPLQAHLRFSTPLTINSSAVGLLRLHVINEIKEIIFTGFEM